MSYTITYTNGGTLLVLADQTEDSVSTSLTLVGKNYNGYGSAVNNNFVHLLENFNNVTAPVSPLTGQLWYDSTAGQIKVYTNNIWKSVGAPILGATQPDSLISGDFWYDTTNSRLWYYNGINLVDLSTPYNSSSGKGGALWETVVDNNNNTWPIINFYSDGNLMGWFFNAETTASINLNLAANPIFSGVATSIFNGFTLNSSNTASYFYGTATSALSLANFTSDQAVELEKLLIGEVFTTTSHVIFESSEGVSVYNTLTNSSFQIYSDGTTSILENNLENAVTKFLYNNINGVSPAITIDSANNAVNILTTQTTQGFGMTVDGSVIINGDLQVVGTAFTITSTILYAADKQLVLNYPGDGVSATEPLNSGIVVDGVQKHTLFYYGQGDSSGKSGQWISSESINLQLPGWGTQDLAYYVNGTKVLDETTLYVNDIQNINTMTINDELIIGPSGSQNTTIITPGQIEVADSLNIQTGGSSSTINVNNSAIINLPDPTTATNAVTLNYFTNELTRLGGGFLGYKPYTLSVDVTDFIDVNQQLIYYLDQVLPVNGGDTEYYAQPPGARCSILCSTYSATTATFILNLSQNQIPAEYFVTSTGTATVTVGTSTEIIVTSTTFLSTGTLDTFVAGTVTIKGPMPTVSYTTKLFQVVQIGTTSSGVASSVSSNYVSGTGTTITIGSTTGIYAGAIMSGNGFMSSQIVIDVLSGTQILINEPPDSTPGVGMSITFTQSPGFYGWVYLKDISY